jgi:hypothetical protein
VIVPCLIGFSWAWGIRVGGVHAVYVLALSVVLMEIVLIRFRKVPFTCTLPLFQNNAIMLVFIYFIGFFVFTEFAAAMEHAMLRRPVLFGIVPLFLLLCWDILRRIRRDTPDIDLELIYEEKEAREVQTLDIIYRGS